MTRHSLVIMKIYIKQNQKAALFKFVIWSYSSCLIRLKSRRCSPMNIKNVMHTILVYLKRMNTITKMSIWKNVRKKLHADKFKIFNNASPLNKFFVPCTNRPNPKAWKMRRVWFIFTFQYEIFINVTQVFNSRRHFLFVQSYIIQWSMT